MGRPMDRQLPPALLNQVLADTGQQAIAGQAAIDLRAYPRQGWRHRRMF